MSDTPTAAAASASPSEESKTEISPQPLDDEDLTISLTFIQRLLTRTEAYLRSQCHLQNFWSLSHVVTIVGFILYLLALVRGNARLQHNAYLFTTYGTVVTYIIVLYRANFEDQIVFNEEKEEVIIKPRIMCVSELMKNENAQLLGYVFLWLFTAPSPVKMAPFFIYSIINLSSYFTVELIPGSPFSNALLPLLNYFEMPLLVAASHFDLFAMSLLVMDAFWYANGYPLVIYVCIWALRYENSTISRSSVKTIVTTVDSVFMLSFMPARVKSEYALWRTNCTFMIPLYNPAGDGVGYEEDDLLDEEDDDTYYRGVLKKKLQ